MENIDTTWNENLEKLHGGKGIHILVNDKKDIISKLIKALAHTDCLPDDLNNPQSIAEVWAVDHYATTLYELFCDGAEIAERMMVADAVEKEYEDIQDEIGNTRNMMAETGHTDGDF